MSMTMNVYGSAYMEGEARKSLYEASADGSLGTKAKGHRGNDGLVTPIPWGYLGSESANWLRGRDLNPRPLGYEPNELPGCSTPQFDSNNRG